MSFASDLAYSKTHDAAMTQVANTYFGEYFASYNPDVTLEQDKLGIDAFINLINDRRYTVDVKADRYDNTSVCLELMSNVENGKVGWAQNPVLKSDYIFYYKPERRQCLVLPAYVLHLYTTEQVAKGGKVIFAKNKHYTSSSLLVQMTDLVKQFGQTTVVDL